MVYKFSTTPVKFPAGFFLETEKLILKFLGKHKGLRIDKTTSKRKEKGNIGDRVPMAGSRETTVPGVAVKELNQQEFIRALAAFFREAESPWIGRHHQDSQA